jgi:hypothetical protein
MTQDVPTVANPGKTQACADLLNMQEVSRRMRVIYFSNEFPNDDLQGLLRQLHILSKDKRHPVLARFLDEATKVVRDEVRDLPTESKKLVPAFESIASLAGESTLRNSRLRGSIDGVLHCLLQLATYIG